VTLDVAGGIMSATPEYPEGVYHYVGIPKRFRGTQVDQSSPPSLPFASSEPRVVAGADPSPAAQFSGNTSAEGGLLGSHGVRSALVLFPSPSMAGEELCLRSIYDPFVAHKLTVLQGPDPEVGGVSGPMGPSTRGPSGPPGIQGIVGPVRRRPERPRWGYGAARDTGYTG
jgi:hypothetical protein